MKKIIYILIFILSCALSVLLVKSSIILSESNVKSTKQQELFIYNENAISLQDSIYNYIISLNIRHPEIVYRQAQLESGNFTSKVFMENNNMFGMKVPYKRPNTVIGENRGYAVYESWQMSIIDYALYQTFIAKNMAEEEYIEHLHNYYAEDTNYKNKLKFKK